MYWFWFSLTSNIFFILIQLHLINTYFKLHRLKFDLPYIKQLNFDFNVTYFNWHWFIQGLFLIDYGMTWLNWPLTYPDLNVIQEWERVDELDGGGWCDLEFELSVL